MQRVSHKMEGLIQAQKKLHERSQADTKSSPAKDRSQYLIAIGGIAAGLTIAVIIMITKSLMTTNTVDSGGVERVMATHRSEIGKLTDSIAQLNGRVEALSQTVAGLETRIARIADRAGSVVNSDAKPASPSPESTESRAAATTDGSAADNAIELGATHIVTARVNLRPAASLKTMPIAVLDAGTEVEYLSASDDWYYVQTRSRGKGWCSSDYLSPLPATQRKTRVR